MQAKKVRSPSFFQVEIDNGVLSDALPESLVAALLSLAMAASHSLSSYYRCVITIATLLSASSITFPVASTAPISRFQFLDFFFRLVEFVKN